MKTFVPYNKIGNQKVTVVDGLHPQNVTFSHWKGSNSIIEIAAETSGEIAINAVEKKIKGWDCPKISATHFDIDGFVGVFTLFEPEFALANKAVLIAMAKIGDFRELNPTTETDLFALKLCCWMNKVEKDRFYRPFERKDEIESCAEKFDYFLPIFKNVMGKIDEFKKDWIEGYDQIIQGLESIQSTEKYGNIGLLVRKMSRPIHYYALFSKTEYFDIVLSIYPNQQYELEYKYTTWVDIASRPSLPRLDFRPLLEQLNELEKSNYTWPADKVSDTGPILRLESNHLSKTERYANPFERKIYSSTIDSSTFQSIIIDYFTNQYQFIKPKKNWTWAEIRTINSL